MTDYATRLKGDQAIRDLAEWRVEGAAVSSERMNLPEEACPFCKEGVLDLDAHHCYSKDRYERFMQSPESFVELKEPVAPAVPRRVELCPFGCGAELRADDEHWCGPAQRAEQARKCSYGEHEPNMFERKDGDPRVVGSAIADSIPIPILLGGKLTGGLEVCVCKHCHCLYPKEFA